MQPYTLFLTIFSQQVVIGLIAFVVIGNLLRLRRDDSVTVPMGAKIADALGWGLLGVFYAGQIIWPDTPITIQRFMVRAPIIFLTFNQIYLHVHILKANRDALNS